MKSKPSIKTQGLSLPSDLCELLRDVAHYRKKRGAENASISGVVLEILDANREKLKKELKREAAKS